MNFLIVGLGNPGVEYSNTPHNLGFMVIDRLAESHAIRVSRKENMALAGLGAIFGVPPELSLGVSLVRRARDLVVGVPILLIWQFFEARRLRGA